MRDKIHIVLSRYAHLIDENHHPRLLHEISEEIEKSLLSDKLSTPLSKVKEYLRENFDEGCECPACGQNVKLYPRKLTSAMAYGLILLVQSKKHDFFHVENYLKEENCPSSIRGDIAKLRHFGLIEKYDGNRDDGSSRNGFYRITERGRMFVDNRITVRSHVYLYNNKVYKYSEERINIEQALGKKFDYNELMGN